MGAQHKQCRQPSGCRASRACGRHQPGVYIDNSVCRCRRDFLLHAPRRVAQIHGSARCGNPGGDAHCRPLAGLPHQRRLARLHLRAARAQPQIHYPRQARCQPRMFRHSHSVGAASAGTQPAAQQRCSRACHHRLDGRGRETVAVVAFLMAQRQRVDLQAFQAPALG